MAEKIKTFINTIWYALMKNGLALIFFPVFRLRVRGRKNVPKSGPVLLLSNHQSFLDPILCQIPLMRHCFYVARESLFRGLFGKLLTSIHAMPIKRGQADLAAMRRIIGTLKEGRVVCLFPEAMRTGDGRIADIKPGFGLLVRRSGAVVVPTVIEGAFECWPRNSKWPRPGKVAVCYGQAIDAEQVKGLGDKKFAKLLTGILREMQHRCRAELGRKPLVYPPLQDNDGAYDGAYEGV